MTVEKARQLKGKKILWLYFGYMGQSEVEEMVVGDILSQYEYNKTQPMKGWPSRSDYWESYMTPEKLQETKETLMLLDASGRDRFIYAHSTNYYPEPTFTCSDADREVYFLLCE